MKKMKLERQVGLAFCLPKEVSSDILRNASEIGTELVRMPFSGRPGTYCVPVYFPIGERMPIENKLFRPYKQHVLLERRLFENYRTYTLSRKEIWLGKAKKKRDV